jgi:hypothetical protein
MLVVSFVVSSLPVPPATRGGAWFDAREELEARVTDQL